MRARSRHREPRRALTSVWVMGISIHTVIDVSSCFILKIVFCLSNKHNLYQIDDLTDLAQNFPGTTIILDHCGGPLGLGEYARESTNVFASWKKSIEKLAACRNVRVKLGGLGMRINGYDFHEKHLPPTSDELVKAWFPYFDTCIQAFGPHRCMFESNFPVDKGSYSYPIYWNACKKFTNDFNIEDREYLFSKTAAEVYRVDL